MGLADSQIQYFWLQNKFAFSGPFSVKKQWQRGNPSRWLPAPSTGPGRYLIALAAALPNPRCTRGETAFFPGAPLLLKLITVPRRLLSNPRGGRHHSQNWAYRRKPVPRRGKQSNKAQTVWPDVVPARWAHACQSSSDNRATGTSAFSGPARRAAASMQIQEYLLSIFYGHSQEQAPSLTITFPAPSSTVLGTEQMFNQVTSEWTYWPTAMVDGSKVFLSTHENGYPCLPSITQFGISRFPSVFPFCSPK